MDGPNELECYNTTQDRRGSDKHSSLLGPFVSCAESEVLLKQAQASGGLLVSNR